MRFLFVRPEFCPSGDLSTPKIRLSSDSASRRTPLPLAKSSRYRATSGLSPYRTCAHRAHNSRQEQTNPFAPAFFASGWRARPTSLLGGVSTILCTASRFFIRSICAFCRSHTGSDEKNTHPGRAERRLRLARQPTSSFGGSLAPPFSVFLQRTRWLVLQTRKKCAIISVSKC